MKAPFPNQLKAAEKVIERLSKFNFIVLEGETGFGKAQPNTEPVLTQGGWKPIGDIKVGDLVFSKKGNLTPVIGVYPQGVKDVYRVTFSDGTSTKCCKEHLWNVSTSNSRFRGKETYVTKELQDIILDYKKETKDKRYPEKVYYRYKYAIPVNDEINMAQKELPLDPYLMGVILGDGGLSCSSVYITNSKKEVLNKVKKLLPKGSLRSTGDSITYRVSDKGETRNILSKLGLMGKLSIEKYIPEIYLMSSISQRKKLFQGLIDTDGYVINEFSNEFSTSSERLMKDMCYLARSLGYLVKVSDRVPTYTYKGNKLKGRKSYRVYIHYPNSSKLKSIVNIERVGNDECTCISIKDNDSLYITRDFIVTHNTITSTYIANKMKSKKVLYVSKAKLIKEFDQSEFYHRCDDIEFLSFSKFVHAKNSDKSVKIAANELYNTYKDCDFIIVDEADEMKGTKSQWGKVFCAFIVQMNVKTLCMSGTFKTNTNKDLFNFMALYKVMNTLDIENTYENVKNIKNQLSIRFLRTSLIKMGSRTIPQEEDQNTEELEEIWKKVAIKVRKVRQSEINVSCEVIPVVVDNSISKLMTKLNRDKSHLCNDKLHQIKKTPINRYEFSDGFLQLENILTEKSHYQNLDSNPKLEKLKEEISKTKGKVIVLAGYNQSLNIIEENIDCIVYRPSPNKDSNEPIRKFKETDAKVLASTVQAISTGFDIDEADTIIYYSFPTIYKQVIQSFARIDRAISTRDKKYKFLVTNIEAKNRIETLRKVRDNAMKFGFSLDFLDSIVDLVSKC